MEWVSNDFGDPPEYVGMDDFASSSSSSSNNAGPDGVPSWSPTVPLGSSHGSSLASSVGSTTAEPAPLASAAAATSTVPPPQRLSDVIMLVDYAPSWAYVEGSVKVLLIGEWDPGRTYRCSFGDVVVEASMVGRGAVACYAPRTDAVTSSASLTYETI